MTTANTTVGGTNGVSPGHDRPATGRGAGDVGTRTGPAANPSPETSPSHSAESGAPGVDESRRVPPRPKRGFGLRPSGAAVEQKVLIAAKVLTLEPTVTARQLAKVLNCDPKTAKRYRAKGWAHLRERLSQDLPDFHARALALVETIGAEARKAGKLSVALDAAKYLADKFAPVAGPHVIRDMTAEEAAAELEEQEGAIAIIMREGLANLPEAIAALPPAVDTEEAAPARAPPACPSAPSFVADDPEPVPSPKGPGRVHSGPAFVPPVPRVVAERIVETRTTETVFVDTDPANFDSPGAYRAYRASRGR